MECPRCHNQNVDRFYQIHGEYYCRQCISFKRVMIKDHLQMRSQKYPPKKISYHLNFQLSTVQKKLSKQLVENYQHHRNSLVLAVCGSGKTEIVFELILYALSQGQRVCFCIPRKELVKELYERIFEAFEGVEIGVLYGQCQQRINAQLIICTMHQLYRFENDVGFDLMIADEVDAFPFYGNDVLENIFQNCCLQNYVKMSATMMYEDKHDEELLIMNRRYHGYDLPVPHMILCPTFLQKFVLIQIIRHLHKKVLVFVPTVSMVDEIRHMLIINNISSSGVSSKHPNRQKTIQDFKESQTQVLVTTTLLERGITIEDIQVIVYQCQNHLFDRRTLIQISGRVGRKPLHPDGNIYFLSNEKTKGMKECIKTIKKLNTMNV